MSDVFISYSRKDKEFVRWLDEALRAHGRDPWVDWEDIRPTEEFMDAIFRAIEGANVFVCVLSPALAASKICAEEIAHALKHNKRIVPVVCREVDAATLLPAVATRNWIFCRDGDDREKAVGQVVEGMDTDLAWVRAHTRLVVRADEWDKGQRNRSFLLSGDDLRRAEEALATRKTGEQPQPTLLQREYVLASRRATSRRQRTTLVGVAVALVVTAVLAVAAVIQWRIAQQRRLEAERETRVAFSQRLVAEARLALSESPQRSLLLTVEAVKVFQSRGERPIPAVEHALRQMLDEVSGHTIARHKGGVTALALSADGRAATTGADKVVRLTPLNAAGPRPGAAPLQGPDGAADTVAISSDGRWLATAGADGSVRLRDLAAPDETVPAVLRAGGETITEVEFSPDNRWLAARSAKGDATLWRLDANVTRAAPLVFPKQGRALAFSHDGKRLATSGDRPDDGVRLWDLSAANPSAKAILVKGYQTEPFALAFSPDDRWLAAANDNDSMSLWDLKPPKPRAEPFLLGAPPLGRSYYRSAITFTPDSKWLVTGGSRLRKALSLWELSAENPSEHAVVLGGQPEMVTCVAVSRDARLLVAGGEDGTVRTWDITSNVGGWPVSIARGPEGAIDALGISADDRWLVAGSEDGTVRRWDLAAVGASPTSIVLRDYEQPVFGKFVVSADNRWLAAGGGEKSARAWDLSARDPAGASLVFQGHPYQLSTLAITPDSRRLATFSGWEMRLWDLKQSAAAIQPPAVPAKVADALFTADGRWLVTHDNNAATAELRRADSLDRADAAPVELSGHKGFIFAMAASPDSRWLVTGSADRTARLWDLAAPDPARASRVLGGHANTVSEVRISRDSRWVATLDYDGGLRLWDLKAQDPSAEPIVLPGHEQMPMDAAFSGDGRWLATCGHDQTVRLWKLTSGRRPGDSPVILRGHEQVVMRVAISPDSRRLVSVSLDGSARVWDLGAADAAAQPIVLRAGERKLQHVVISPDSRWFAVAGEEKEVLLWDFSALYSGAAPILLRGHGRPVSALGTTADGRWLISASADDHTVRLWHLRLDDLLELARMTASRNLTPEEFARYFPGQPYRETFAGPGAAK